MRLKFILIIIFLLNSCYMNDNGCLVLPQSVHCFHPRTEYPYIAQFQKQYSIGHTNSELRWIDIKNCEGINISKENNKFNIRNERDSEGFIVPQVVDKFEMCMKHKGYVVFYPAQCGYQEKPTGKCNL